MSEDLDTRLTLLEKKFREHLGPQLGASSLNTPHPELSSSSTDLTTRITELETEMALVLASAGRYL